MTSRDSLRNSSRRDKPKQRRMPSNKLPYTRAEFKVCNAIFCPLCIETKRLPSVAQEEMIQELTSQLARVDSLTKEGKISTLHFLTREAADEERRGVERQVEKLKQALRDRDKTISERDATINSQAEESRFDRACPSRLRITLVSPHKFVHYNESCPRKSKGAKP